MLPAMKLIQSFMSSLSIRHFRDLILFMVAPRSCFTFKKVKALPYSLRFVPYLVDDIIEAFKIDCRLKFWAPKKIIEYFWHSEHFSNLMIIATAIL